MGLYASTIRNQTTIRRLDLEDAINEYLEKRGFQAFSAEWFYDGKKLEPTAELEAKVNTTVIRPTPKRLPWYKRWFGKGYRDTNFEYPL